MSLSRSRRSYFVVPLETLKLGDRLITTEAMFRKDHMGSRGGLLFIVFEGTPFHF